MTISHKNQISALPVLFLFLVISPVAFAQTRAGCLLSNSSLLFLRGFINLCSSTCFDRRSHVALRRIRSRFLVHRQSGWYRSEEPEAPKKRLTNLAADLLL